MTLRGPRSPRRARRPLGLALLLLAPLLAALGGCTLLSKSDPLEVHYMTPPLAEVTPAAPGDRPALRLRRVQAAAHLRQPLLVAVSRHVYRHDDALSWTEDPAGYLERALGRALFEGGAFRRGVLDTERALEVELQAFELAGEPRPDDPPRLRARVAVRLVLSDQRAVHGEGTLVAERPLPDEADGDAIAAAMGEALAEVVRGVFERARAVGP